MIAAVNMQWLGIGIAALVVAALLIVVLIRHRGEDEPAMTAAPRTFAVSEPRAGVPSGPQAEVQAGPQANVPSGPPPGWGAPVATPLATTSQAPAAAPAAPSQAPLTPPAPVVATAPPLSAAPTGSFLDEPLVRGFEGLGEVAAPAKPVSSGPFPVDPFGSHEDIFPAEKAAGAPDAEAPVAAPVDPFGSHEDIFPAEAPPVAPDAASAAAEPIAAAEPKPAEPVTEPEPAATPTDATPEPKPAEPAAAPTVAPDPVAPGAPTAESEPAATPAESPPAAPAAAAEAEPKPPAAADDPALLSDIIVTSGSEEIDLADPDVRDLLTQLVDDEIELARACHAQGEILDAILQLTEAEKASAALGLDDRLATVKALLAELQA